MRKSGFLSANTLLDSRGATVFTQCKTVKQCFKDKFTFHGSEFTRRVYVPGSALGSSSPRMIDWRAGNTCRLVLITATVMTC